MADAQAASDWSLDARLAADCVAAGDLPLCRVLVLDDAQYPWLVLAPRRAGSVEIVDLAVADQRALMNEIAQASEALRRLTRCDKLNVAALGNVVPQLHVHVVARFVSDAAWPRPVWGAVPPRRYAKGAREAFLAQVRRALPLV